MEERESQVRETVKVGWVQQAHGIRGEVYVRLYHPQPDWLDEMKHLILISPQGLSVRYPVEKLRPHKKGLIVACRGITDRNRAEELKGYSVEMPRSDLVVACENEGMYLNEVLHFRVFVRGRGVIGKVNSFISHKGQDLLVVEGEGRYSYEIPFVDAYIQSISFEDSQIDMELPEGLLELYEA